MAARSFYNSLYDPPRPGEILLVVLVVSVATEWLRYALHPEGFPAASWPMLIRIASVTANVGFHLWSMPDNNQKAMVSAFLGEVGMPTVVGIVGGLATAILKAVIIALGQLTDAQVP